jgi:hypothetical protein
MFAEDISNAQEVVMPQQWPDQTFAKLFYRMPESRALEVAILKEGDDLLLHWSPYDSNAVPNSAAVHSTTIPTGQFFSDSPNAVEAYHRDTLRDLIGKFAPGIDLVLQGENRASSEQGPSSLAATGHAQPTPDQPSPGRDARPPTHSPLLHPDQPRPSGTPRVASCK